MTRVMRMVRVQAGCACDVATVMVVVRCTFNFLMREAMARNLPKSLGSRFFSLVQPVGVRGYGECHGQGIVSASVMLRVRGC